MAWRADPSHRSIFAVLIIASASCALATPPLPQSTFFVPNQGQWDGNFAFRFDAPGATYFLSSSGMTVDLHIVEAPSQTGRWSAVWPSPTSVGERERVGDNHSIPSSFSPSPTVCHPDGTPEGSRARTVRGHVLTLSFLSSNPIPTLIGEDLQSSYSNYFLSRDSCRWKSRVPHYGKVIAEDVWPGIDIEFLPTPEGVELTYHLHPFADPAQIQLTYEGQDAPITVDANGSLLLQTSLGLAKEKAPFAYQIVNHQQIEIPCRFELLDSQSYRVVLGPYDATQEVVIDPELVYSTYWGHGANNGAYGVVVDPDNQPIISGYDWAGIQTTPGAYQDTVLHAFDGFVTKFSANGHSLIYSTYFPASMPAIFPDPDGSILVAGDDAGEDWPVTPNGFDTTYNGGQDMSLAEISADGTTLLWGSRWGGSRNEYIGWNTMSVSTDGILYAVCTTESGDFPLTENALYRERESAYALALVAFNLRSMTVELSSYLQVGTRTQHRIGVAALPGGNVWVWGGCDTAGVLPVTPDALFPTTAPSFGSFFVHINIQPAAIMYASYLGNQVAGSYDELVTLVPLDSSRLLLAGGVNPNHVGFTMPSGGYQTTPRGCFLLKLSLPDSLIAGTFLGGSYADGISCVAVDSNGSVVVTGVTLSDDFPVTPDALQSQHHPGQNGAGDDWYVSRLSSDLSRLRYSTYLGGSDREWQGAMAMNDPAHLWIGGATYSHDYPTTPDALMQNQSTGDYAVLSCFDLRDSADAVTPCTTPLPESFTISAFPNPFNPITTLTFTLPSSSPVKLEVFNVLGRSVYQKDLGRMSAGEHRQVFDGAVLSSGVYFARLQTSQESHIQKLLLLR